jgi:hypothetical protein
LVFFSWLLPRQSPVLSVKPVFFSTPIFEGFPSMRPSRPRPLGKRA